MKIIILIYTLIKIFVPDAILDFKLIFIVGKVSINHFNEFRIMNWPSTLFFRTPSPVMDIRIDILFKKKAKALIG